MIVTGTNTPEYWANDLVEKKTVTTKQLAVKKNVILRMVSQGSLWWIEYCSNLVQLWAIDYYSYITMLKIVSELQASNKELSETKELLTKEMASMRHALMRANLLIGDGHTRRAQELLDDCMDPEMTKPTMEVSE